MSRSADQIAILRWVLWSVPAASVGLATGIFLFSRVTTGTFPTRWPQIGVLMGSVVLGLVHLLPHIGVAIGGWALLVRHAPTLETTWLPMFVGFTSWTVALFVASTLVVYKEPATLVSLVPFALVSVSLLVPRILCSALAPGALLQKTASR